MSKYAEIRALMGGQEDYNDKTKNGRVLKWYANTSGLPLAERKLQASQVLQKLIDAGVWYVQKVEVRNATGSAFRDGFSIVFQDDDKVCVHIDPI
jgi:phosphoserine aminotransferase